MANNKKIALDVTDWGLDGLVNWQDIKQVKAYLDKHGYDDTARKMLTALISYGFELKK